MCGCARVKAPGGKEGEYKREVKSQMGKILK